VEIQNTLRHEKLIVVGFPMCQPGANVYGIDPSQRGIDKCETHIPKGEFLSQAAEVLPFDNESFGFVTCLGSLEYFVVPVIALKETGRVSKRDALFVIWYRIPIFSSEN
jgi:ubiquinone/menaquinone biosynthesis C-methylase UbiE